MAGDFLDKFAPKSKELLGNQKSPYKLGKEPSKTAQIRLSTYKDIKRIAFESDEKVVDILDDLIQIGLRDSKYSNYLKKWGLYLIIFYLFLWFIMYDLFFMIYDIL